jgi:hypothetical protein
MSDLAARLRERAEYPGDGCDLRSVDRALLREAADALERSERALRQIVRDYCESEGKNPSDETVEMIIRQYGGQQKREQAAYEAGESSQLADWQFALTEIADYDGEVSPTAVARYLKSVKEKHGLIS